MCISGACSLLVTIVNSCVFYWQCLQSAATSIYPDLTCSRRGRGERSSNSPQAHATFGPDFDTERYATLSLSPLNPESRLRGCIRTRCVPMSVSMRLWIRPLGLSPLVRWGQRDPLWPRSLQPCRQEGLAIGFSCDPPPRSSLRQTVFKGYMAYAIISTNTLQLRGSDGGGVGKRENWSSERQETAEKKN